MSSQSDEKIPNWNHYDNDPTNDKARALKNGVNEVAKSDSWHLTCNAVSERIFKILKYSTPEFHPLEPSLFLQTRSIKS
jgi:hypothetical protein